jgi:hypothetical protein
MSSPEEMQSQSGKHAADAADEDIVIIDEANGASAMESRGPGSMAPQTADETDGASSVADERRADVPPSAAAEADGASPMAAEERSGMPPSAADDADDALPMAGVPSSAAAEADDASPMAAEGRGGMPPRPADEANDASPMGPGQPRTARSAAGQGPRTGASAAPQTAGASPMADDVSSPGSRDLWSPPPSTEGEEGAGARATGGAAAMPPGAPGTGPSASQDDQRWREIQGMFVDDPRDSVQRASDLIDTAIEDFLAEIRQQQSALASSWQNRDADTEVLRVALKDYRALWAVVRDMPAVSATGGAAAASAGAGGSSFGAGPGGSVGQHEPEQGGTRA